MSNYDEKQKFKLKVQILCYDVFVWSHNWQLCNYSKFNHDEKKYEMFLPKFWNTAKLNNYGLNFHHLEFLAKSKPSKQNNKIRIFGSACKTKSFLHSWKNWIDIFVLFGMTKPTMLLIYLMLWYLKCWNSNHYFKFKMYTINNSVIIILLFNYFFHYMFNVLFSISLFNKRCVEIQLLISFITLRHFCWYFLPVNIFMFKVPNNN